MSCSGLNSLVGIPPPVSELAEFFELERIDVDHCRSRSAGLSGFYPFQSESRLDAISPCAALTCTRGIDTSAPSSTRKPPSTQTWVTCSRPAA